MTDKRCKMHKDRIPKLIVNEPGSYHYGNWICSECSKYITHAKSPKTTEAVRARQKSILDKILSTPNMDRVDLDFLCSIYMIGTLNLVQEACYMKIMS